MSFSFFVHELEQHITNSFWAWNTYGTQEQCSHQVRHLAGRKESFPVETRKICNVSKTYTMTRKDKNQKIIKIKTIWNIEPDTGIECYIASTLLGQNPLTLQTSTDDLW